MSKTKKGTLFTLAILLLGVALVGLCKSCEQICQKQRLEEEKAEQERNHRKAEWEAEEAENMRLLRIQDSIRKVEYREREASQASSASSMPSSSYHHSSSEDEYGSGYEDGYEDGLHRDHGNLQESDEGEYGDGYSQGYYDAVQEDRDDFDDDDDEEEGW